MKQNNYGEMIFNEDDVLDQLMKGRDIDSLKGMLVDETVNIEQIVNFVDQFPTTFIPYTFTPDHDIAVPVWDAARQKTWHMPQQYQDMDIAEYVLNLCADDAELQRCGEELLLYQQHDLFNLLKYLKYLVDVMKENHVIWGVGRGSSVASFVLYKLGVHKINSIFYNLSITEFLR
jgi:DNA polymerase III alpha subunit